MFQVSELDISSSGTGIYAARKISIMSSMMIAIFILGTLLIGTYEVDVS
jgi:hypothetical protein